MRSVFKLISSTILSLMISFLVINCTLSVVALSPDITSYRDTDFSVSIPTSLPVYVDGVGNVSVSNNAVITNNRDSNITVEGVAIETLGSSWTKVDTPTTLIDRNEYSINVGVPTSTIAPMSSTNINYNAQISPQRNSLNDVKIANVIFTIAYTEVLGCNADLTLQNLMNVVSVKSGKFSSTVDIDKATFQSLQAGNYCTGLKLYVTDDYTTDQINNTIYVSSIDTKLVFECDCGHRYSCNASKTGITNFIIVQQAVSLSITEGSTVSSEQLPYKPITGDKACRQRLVESIEYTTTEMLDGIKVDNTRYDSINADTDCRLDKIYLRNEHGEDILAEFNTAYYPSVDMSNDTYLIVRCTHGDEVIIHLNKLGIKILDDTESVPVEEEAQAEDGTQDNISTDDVEVDLGNVDVPMVDTDLTEDTQQSNTEGSQDEKDTNVINGTIDSDNVHELS